MCCRGGGTARLFRLPAAASKSSDEGVGVGSRWKTIGRPEQNHLELVMAPPTFEQLGLVRSVQQARPPAVAISGHCTSGIVRPVGAPARGESGARRAGCLPIRGRKATLPEAEGHASGTLSGSETEVNARLGHDDAGLRRPMRDSGARCGTQAPEGQASGLPATLPGPGAYPSGAGSTCFRGHVGHHDAGLRRPMRDSGARCGSQAPDAGVSRPTWESGSRRAGFRPSPSLPATLPGPGSQLR